MVNNKRGIMTSTLAKYIVGIVVFLILLTITGKIMANVKDSAVSSGACHDAIYADQAAAKFLSAKEYAKTFPTMCKPEEIVIKEKDKEEVKKRLLELMDRCFWTYGEGNFFPFDKDAAAVFTDQINNFLGLTSTASETIGYVSCAVCSIVEIKNMEGTIKQDEIREMLMKEKTSKGEVYYNYFNYPEAAKAFEMKSAQSTGDEFGGAMVRKPIKKGEVYSVNFVSSINNPRLSHPTIDVLEGYSKYCYPR